jgi:integrase
MANFRKRNGKWQAQVRRLGHPALTKTFLHRKDAEAWARHAEADLDRTVLPVDAKKLRSVTLGELVQQYAREVTPRKKSAYAEKSRIRLILADPLARVPLARLTTSLIREYLERRMVTVCGETARKDGKLIRQVLDAARRHWNIGLGANPADLVDLPPPSKPRTRRLTNVDVTRLELALARTRSRLLSAAIELAINTGMRRGELLAARWADLDIERNVLMIPTTKTGQPRTIPLTPSALSTIERLRSQSAGSDRLLPVSANALRLAWERLKKRAGVEDLRFHDLRHEAVSRFFEAGLSVPEVALISGHRDPRMLFRYTHLRPEDVAKKLRTALPPTSDTGATADRPRPNLLLHPPTAE